MASKQDHEPGFFIVNILLIVVGLAYVFLRFGFARVFPAIGSENLTNIVNPLLVLWLIVILTWLVMVVRRHRREQAVGLARSRRPRNDKITTPKTRLPSAPSARDDVWSHTLEASRVRQGGPDSSVVTLQPLTDSLQTDLLQNAFFQIKPQPVSLPAHRHLAANVLREQPARPVAWSLPLLQQLAWQRFDMVCVGFFHVIGRQAISLANGPDADVSLRVRPAANGTPHALVKAVAGDVVVEIDQIRVMHAAMTRHKVLQGFCITAGTFTPLAEAAARGVGLFPIDGATLLATLLAMPAAQCYDLLERVSEGDFMTPTCPTCKQKMELLGTDIKSLWRCLDYPSCKIQLRPARNLATIV